MLATKLESPSLNIQWRAPGGCKHIGRTRSFILYLRRQWAKLIPSAASLALFGKYPLAIFGKPRVLLLPIFLRICIPPLFCSLGFLGFLFGGSWVLGTPAPHLFGIFRFA